MAQLEHTLLSEGIEFNQDGNHIQCFPHIINLACQAFLNELKANPHALCLYIPPTTSDSTKGSTILRKPPTTLELHRYTQSLTKDLIGTCQNLHDGNSTLPVLQLLHDCETCWSSTCQMICQVLQLYPQSEYQFTEDDLGVLQDIDQVLEVSHKVQELLSTEKTLTLSLALPLYEVLLEKWWILQNTIPELSHYIGVGILKIEEYVSLARNTQIYVHAMILNPAIKFKWMKDNWPPECVNEA
ncbi:hypothetical protein BDQ17DRAFT_1242876 [Cyathus striatus]|nr:hypothetical protein BDQ17DRAFT_1242876 [Cyathus striatus]